MKAEHFSRDVRELLRQLDRHDVRFLLVGGEAVIYHGRARLTGDVDGFYDRAGDDPARLYGALAAFWGGDIPGVSTADELRASELVIQYGRPPDRIVLLSIVSGLTFEEAWPHRVEERHRGRCAALRGAPPPPSPPPGGGSPAAAPGERSRRLRLQRLVELVGEALDVQYRPGTPPYAFH